MSTCLSWRVRLRFAVKLGEGGGRETWLATGVSDYLCESLIWIEERIDTLFKENSLQLLVWIISYVNAEIPWDLIFHERIKRNHMQQDDSVPIAGIGILALKSNFFQLRLGSNKQISSAQIRLYCLVLAVVQYRIFNILSVAFEASYIAFANDPGPY